MDAARPSVKLNMLMNVILTVSSIVFPLVTMPYVTRILGPDQIGRVYFASSVVAGLSVFAELGIPVYGIRACARVRDDREQLSRTMGEILVINICSCVLTYTALAAALILIPALREDWKLITVMSSTIILNALGAEWLYKALEKYTYITVRTVALKLIAMAGIFTLVGNSSDTAIYGALTVFATAASGVVNIIGIRHYAHTGTLDFSVRKAAPDIKECLRRHLPAMLTLFSLAAATMIYTSLDLAFLDFLRGDAEAGLYGVAVKIKLVLVNVITAISAVLLPRTSLLYARGRMSEFAGLLRKTTALVILISVSAAAVFIIFADLCIDILAGSEFAGAVLPMRIILPSIIFIAVSNITGIQLLVPAGRERDVSRAAWLGAAADVLLNLILIPRFASAGAAAATLMSEMLVCTYLLICVKRVWPGFVTETGNAEK